MRSLLFNKYLWSLTLGHFSIDLYAGAMPVVLLLLTAGPNCMRMCLSLEQIGLLSFLYTMCSSVSQPLFGYLADRYGGRWLASGGLLWMSIFQGLIGFLPNYTALLLVAPLAGFGSAAFHPQGASSASIASGERKAAGMSIFLLGGNGGFAVGPQVATIVLTGIAVLGIGWQGFGLAGTAVIALFGLIVAPVLFLLSRQNPSTHTFAATARGVPRLETNRAFTKGAIISLILVMTLRAWMQSSVSLFVPQFFTRIAALTIAEASVIASLILGALALGTFVGGFFTDKLGGRTVMVLSLLLSAPATYALFGLPNINTYFSAVMLGLGLGAAWPPTLVLAQSLFPKNAGVASGIALGFVFAMGGFGNYVTAFVAERVGLRDAMLALAVLPLIAAVFTLALPTHSAVARGAQLARSTAEVATPEAASTVGR